MIKVIVHKGSWSLGLTLGATYEIVTPCGITMGIITGVDTDGVSTCTAYGAGYIELDDLMNRAVELTPLAKEAEYENN